MNDAVEKTVHPSQTVVIQGKTSTERSILTKITASEIKSRLLPKTSPLQDPARRIIAWPPGPENVPTNKDVIINDNGRIQYPVIQ